MITYVVVNKQSLHVEATYGEPLRDALLIDFPVENYEHVVLPENVDRLTVKAKYENGNYILVSDVEALFLKLRMQRDSLLDKTDKYLAADYPHPTEEVKQAWLNYRQALRDLPANTTDPENPVWPTPPQ